MSVSEESPATTAPPSSGIADPAPLRLAGFALTTFLLSAKNAGCIGILTALCAWYASAAGVANGMGGKLRLPVGTPLLS